MTGAQQAHHDYGERHLPAVRRALLECLPHIVVLREATLEEDRQRATDLVLEASGSVAVRVRQPEYLRYRDLTLRAWVEGRERTELDKIREGWGRWYFYAWSDGRDGLAAWMLVDLDRLRASGLLEGLPLRLNPDRRSGFVSLGHAALKRAGCVAAEMWG